MKNANITKTMLLIAILALIQIAVFAQKAELVVQTGHTESVESLAFSLNGKILASGGADLKIKLWDVSTGQELKTLSGHTDLISSIKFSPDGDSLFSASWDKTIKIWDIESGKEIITLNGHEKSVCSIAITPNGSMLASGERSIDRSQNIIKLWDLRTGKEIKTLVGHNSFDISVIFSPDGKTLISQGFMDGITKIWDVENGQELYTLPEHFATTFSVNGMSVAFSKDHKSIILRNGKNLTKIWEESNNEKFTNIEVQQKVIDFLTFLPDEKTLVSFGGNDKSITLWDTKTGQELKTLTGHEAFIKVVQSSPDGKLLASADYYGKIKFWDVISGAESKTLLNHSKSITMFSVSSDGSLLATGDFEGDVKIWQLSSGEQLKILKGHTDSIKSLKFSSDNKLLISGSWDETARLWDLSTGKVIRILAGHKDNINSVDFSPDDKMIVTGSGPFSGSIGARNYDYDEEPPPPTLLLTPEEKWEGPDRSIKLWDIETGKLLKTFSSNIASFLLVAISPDNKTIISENASGIIEFRNIDSGKVIDSFKKDVPQKISTVLEIIPDFYSRSESEQYIKDGKILIKKEFTGNLEVFETSKNKLILSLITIDENDWAVVDPEGRFDASPGAQKLMHFVVGLEPIDLEQIKDRYYTPNLLQRILKGENLDATRKVSVFTADELYPLAEYEPLKANETVLNIKLKNRGGGIGRVQVFVNGAEFLADARPKGFDPKSKSAEVKIDFSKAKTLKKGEANEIKIIARNEAGWLRSRGSEIFYLDGGEKDDTPQEFYAIIGGVSDYENSAYNLRYSAKDARDFAKAVELGAIKLFGKDRVHIRLLASGGEGENSVLTGADSKHLAPTKENFRKSFEEFRKAKPTDVLVVYLAGHGTSINRGGDTGDTYLFLTQEAVTTDKSRLLDDKLRNDTTVSSEELAEWIRDVPVLKRAMILDTCAAGAVETSLTRARDLSPDQIKALDRMKDRTGFYVLMGSAADAQSYEATRYGQGLLTYSLLQGMSGASLQRGGEYADINSLFNYAEDTVTEMAKGIGGIQQPRIIAPTESRSFDIGQFSTVEKAQFTLAKVKPLILQPQLSNDKLKFDNLKLSQTVAKALRDESSTVSRDGAEAKIVFVEAEEMNDAVTPGGVYEVTGDQIKVTLILIRNNEPVKTVTVEGSAADKEDLSRKIVRAIIENAPN